MNYTSWPRWPVAPHKHFHFCFLLFSFFLSSFFQLTPSREEGKTLSAAEEDRPVLLVQHRDINIRRILISDGSQRGVQRVFVYA